MNSSVPYRIALYIRLSIEDSKVDSLSIENQKNSLHRFVDSMEGIRNVEVLEFVDNGYSGTNFERPAVQNLLDMLRNGKINCIIVKDFTRFGRNAIEVGYFMERVFPLYGIRFISINDDFDNSQYQEDTGGLGVAFKYLIAEYYSRDMSIKSKTAKYVKMKRGEYQSTICPYGYRKGEDGRMVPDEETAPNVRLIFELAKEGKNTSQIIRTLYDNKIQTPGEYKTSKGIATHDISRCCGIWEKSTISRMLVDERYAGTYIIGKRCVTEVGSRRVRMKDESEWFKIPNHHPPIISMELYNQVQSQLTHRRCIKKRKKEYILKGRVFCGNCHHALTRSNNKIPYYFCRHIVMGEHTPCHGISIREDELESMIYSVLSKQAQIILNVDNLADADALELQLAELNGCNKQVENYKAHKRMLYEQLLLQEITMDEYKARKAEIDGELARLDQIYTTLQAQTEQAQMNEDAKQARWTLAKKVIGSNGLTTELVDKLIERMYIYLGNQVEIVWKMKDFCVSES